MVHFIVPKNKSFALSVLEDAGLHDFMLADEYLYAQQDMTPEIIDKVEHLGFMRADVFEYIIDPEPAESDRPVLLGAFGQVPSSTSETCEALTGISVTFLKAVSPEGLKTIRNMGYRMWLFNPGGPKPS